VGPVDPRGSGESLTGRSYRVRNLYICLQAHTILHFTTISPLANDKHISLFSCVLQFMASPKRRRDGSGSSGAGAGVAATSASPTIPDELMIEILSRVPVKALMRFRCVSKYWNSFVFDPNLVKLHLQRSPRDNPILYTLSEYDEFDDDAHFLHRSSTQRLLQNPPSVVGNQEDGVPVFANYANYDVVGVCNGLVCLSRLHTNLDEIWVRFWNPATRFSSDESPSCYIEYGCANMAFGHDASTDTYKVVAAVMSDYKCHKIELRVHNLGDDCWREIPTSYADFPVEFRQPKGVFLNGTLNWVAVAELGTGNSESFVDFCFDVASESYTCFKLPDDVGEGFSELGVFGGCLCLSHIYHRESFAFWQMKEFGVHESWTLLMNISYDYFEFPRYLIPRPLCLSEDGNILILVCHAEYQLVRCNRRALQIEHFEIPHKWVSLKSTDYVESLVLPYRTT